MSENTEKMDSKIIDRLDELLDYVHHVGKLNQKPIFRIEEYKQLNIWQGVRVIINIISTT